MRKSLVIGLLLAVMVLATIGGVALAQDPTAPPQQPGWCHGSDGVVCQPDVCTSTNSGCVGCPRYTPPAVQSQTK